MTFADRSSLPQVPVIEEQPWLEFNLAEPQFWIGKRALRIDVNDVRANARGFDPPVY
jgi:hypothetical protein